MMSGYGFFSGFGFGDGFGFGNGFGDGFGDGKYGQNVDATKSSSDGDEEKRSNMG